MTVPKNIVIVGGSTGIGRASAEALHQQGHQVFVLSRSASKAELPQGITTIDYDATTDTWPTDQLPTVIHGLVYCPGTIKLRMFHQFKEDDFLNDYKVNVLGAVRSIQGALPQLKKNTDGVGSIVLFSTVAASVGMPFHASIAASKAALQGLAISLAAELAPAIRVNVIAPSITETPLSQSLLNTDSKREASAQRHPLKRFGLSTDLSNAVQFLLSEQSDWITGTVLPVDGGLSSLKV